MVFTFTLICLKHKNKKMEIFVKFREMLNLRKNKQKFMEFIQKNKIYIKVSI